MRRRRRRITQRTVTSLLNPAKQLKFEGGSVIHEYLGRHHNSRSGPNHALTSPSRWRHHLTGKSGFMFSLNSLIYAEMVLLNTCNPNIESRGAETLSNLDPPASRDALLTVYPTKRKSISSLLEVDKFLKDLYGKEHVEFNRESFSWSISLQNGDTMDALQGHPGIRLSEEEEEESETEDLYYIALAANPDDDEQTKATGEFL